MQIAEIQMISFIISIAIKYMAFCYLISRFKKMFLDAPTSGIILNALKISSISVIAFLSLKRILPDSVCEELKNPYVLLNMFFGETLFEKDGQYVNILIGITIFIALSVVVGKIIAPAISENGNKALEKARNNLMFKNKK